MGTGIIIPRVYLLLMVGRSSRTDCATLEKTVVTEYMAVTVAVDFSSVILR